MITVRTSTGGRLRTRDNPDGHGSRYSSDLLVPVEGRPYILLRVFTAQNSWDNLMKLGNPDIEIFYFLKDFIMMRIGHESGHRSLDRK